LNFELSFPVRGGSHSRTNADIALRLASVFTLFRSEFTSANQTEKKQKFEKIIGQSVAVAALQSVQGLWPVMLVTRTLRLLLSNQVELPVWCLECVNLKLVAAI
jgi:hypothetical protein